MHLPFVKLVDSRIRSEGVICAALGAADGRPHLPKKVPDCEIEFYLTPFRPWSSAVFATPKIHKAPTPMSEVAFTGTKAKSFQVPAIVYRG
jgi:hypothetical protein